MEFALRTKIAASQRFGRAKLPSRSIPGMDSCLAGRLRIVGEPEGPAHAVRTVFRPGSFDQRIVVTGGGSGIGRCTAHELASLRAFVALVGRNREKLITVAAEISEAGYRPPTLHVCDIREENQGQRDHHRTRARTWTFRIMTA